MYFLILTAEYEKKANNETGLAETYGDIGSVYVKLGKQDSAFIYFKLAEKIAVKTNNMRVLTAINNNLGSIARERHDYTSAIRYITKSIEKFSVYVNEEIQIP